MRLKIRFLYLLITLIYPVLFLSCGIEEYFYLPQVNQININRILNDTAEITIVHPGSEFNSYFRNYAIYYKIYVSEYDNISTIDPLGKVTESFSAEYNNDYNAILRYADPSNLTSSTGIDQLFLGRNYYTLNFEGKNNNSMMPPGNTLRIIFPTSGEKPYATILDGSAEEVPLMRSISDLTLINLIPDQFFFNTDELRENKGNADVARNENAEEISIGEYTYVSMYIVSVGFNVSTITNFLSKPTFINLFKMF